MLCCLTSLIIFTLGPIIAISLLFVLGTSPKRTLVRNKKEEEYFDPVEKKRRKFPSIKEPSSVNLSIVIPAYNEENRLPVMLDECMSFLESRKSKLPNFTYEVIIVSDGSTDLTAKVGLTCSEKFTSKVVRVLELNPNRGKGGAVTLGVECARGAIILFADADGATNFLDITKLESALEKITKKDYLKSLEIAKSVSEEQIVICGSRAHLEEEAVAKRTLFRNLLMHGFHFLVWLLAVRTVRDTQCGFKLFTRKAAQTTFASLHVTRWAFDVELLYICERLGIRIIEIPVRWQEIDGSKLVPVFSWIQMGGDLVLIWIRYKLGVWKLIDN